MAAAVAVLLLVTGCTGDDSTPPQAGSGPTEEPTAEETTPAEKCPRAESQATTLVQGWHEVVATNGNPRSATVADKFAADVTGVSDLIGASCRGDSELGGLQVQAGVVADQAKDGLVSRAVMVATATTGNAWLASIKIDDQRFKV